MTNAAMANSAEAGRSESPRQLHQRALREAARGSGSKINVQDLVWLAAMSERLEKRISDPIYRVRLLRMVLDESRAVGLDPQLVLAVIDVESSFKEDALSKSGAMGLTQVMPFWLDVYNRPEVDLFDPLTSLRFGSNILRHYIDRYDNVRNALAAYNGSLGLSTYPDLVFARYRKNWQYSLNPNNPLSLAANTGPVISETVNQDNLGVLQLPESQIALTKRPAPTVTERAAVPLAFNDNSVLNTSFYDAQDFYKAENGE